MLPLQRKTEDGFLFNKSCVHSLWNLFILWFIFFMKHELLIRGINLLWKNINSFKRRKWDQVQWWSQTNMSLNMLVIIFSNIWQIVHNLLLTSCIWIIFFSFDFYISAPYSTHIEVFYMIFTLKILFCFLSLRIFLGFTFMRISVSLVLY